MYVIIIQKPVRKVVQHQTHLIGRQWLGEGGTRGSGNLTHPKHGPHNLAAGLYLKSELEFRIHSSVLALAKYQQLHLASKNVPDGHCPTHIDITWSILLATALTMAWSRKCWWNLSRFACQ